MVECKTFHFDLRWPEVCERRELRLRAGRFTWPRPDRQRNDPRSDSLRPETGSPAVVGTRQHLAPQEQASFNLSFRSSNLSGN